MHVKPGSEIFFFVLTQPWQQVVQQRITRRLRNSLQDFDLAVFQSLPTLNSQAAARAANARLRIAWSPSCAELKSC
jgi:hypothetical protein